MTILHKAAMSCLFFTTLWNVVFGADLEKDYEQAKLVSISAWASMAAYDDKTGTLAQEELRSNHWKIDAIHYKTPHSDIKYKTFQKKDVLNGAKTLILSITGTSTAKDIKSDVHVHTQPYHDNDKKDDTVPLVHSGFNTYASELLSSPLPTTNRSVEQEVNEAQQVIVTGHSLGGAVATIMATRLEDKRNRSTHTLQVITFGAPSVGNKAYYDQEVKNIPIKAIAFKNDPVHKIVQDVLGRYGEYDKTILWEEPSCTTQFSHSIVTYVEEALHQYYDAKWAYEGTNSAPKAEHSEYPRHTLTYGPQIEIDVDDDSLQEEIPYIRGILEDHIQRSSQSTLSHIENKTPTNTSVIREYIHGYKVKHKDHIYRLEIERRVYTLTGKLLSSTFATTDTGEFPPLLAIIYCHQQLEKLEEEK